MWGMLVTLELCLGSRMKTTKTSGTIVPSPSLCSSSFKGGYVFITVDRKYDMVNNIFERIFVIPFKMCNPITGTTSLRMRRSWHALRLPVER